MGMGRKGKGEGRGEAGGAFRQIKQESRAAARKPRDAASVLFR